MRGAYACVEDEREGKRRERRAERRVAGARDLRHGVDPPRRPGRMDPLVEGEAGRPGGHPAPAHRDGGPRPEQEVPASTPKSGTKKEPSRSRNVS
jgi:hypothetical protein